MSTYELWKSGQLDSAIKKGLLKNKVVLYCEIFQAFTRTRLDNKYNDSMDLTAEAMNVTVSTVKRAISLVSK